MKQTIYFVMTTKMGPFVSIIQHIIFERYFAAHQNDMEWKCCYLWQVQENELKVLCCK